MPPNIRLRVIPRSTSDLYSEHHCNHYLTHFAPLQRHRMMSFSYIHCVARASRHALFAIPKHSPTCAVSSALSHSTALRPMSIFAKAGLRSSPFSQPHSASIIRPIFTSFSRMNIARSSQQLRYSSSLRIHNPQLDEAGKELTVEITDNAVKVCCMTHFAFLYACCD